MGVDTHSAAALVQLSLSPDFDHVGILRIADADGRNALSEPLVHALLARLAEAAQDERIHCLVLCGLPDVFCAGASRDMLASIVQGRIAPTDILLSKAVLDLPMPVVAAMAGHAIGGGLALGLCADILVLARESRYGASFMNMGFTPGMGITKLLEHVMSPALAAEILFSGEPRRGRDFIGMTGVNYIVPRVEVEERAFAVAARIAEKPRTSLQLLKRTLSLPRRQAFEATRTMESLMHEISFGQPDAAKRIEENYD
ncbi:MAG: enoyl-CoA hydratase/isomerase family protein [Myxococcales bacterium]|nr:enoyl-CoA hydratase/isomerase family protein [Myxococcales bacterium]